jgi:hypothetical protein
MPIKAIFKQGLWVVTAIVQGEVREYVGKSLKQATEVLERDKAGREFLA